MLPSAAHCPLRCVQTRAAFPLSAAHGAALSQLERRRKRTQGWRRVVDMLGCGWAVQHFARAISSHLEQAALQGLSGIDEWHASTVGRLQHITLKVPTIRAVRHSRVPMWPATLPKGQHARLKARSVTRECLHGPCCVMQHAAKVEPILESTLKALSIVDPPIYPAALITMQNQLLRSGCEAK